MAICAFSMLVYNVVVTERRMPVAAVAAALEVTPAVLYSRMHGRTRFRPEEARRLVEVLGDPRLVRWFADDSRFVVAERPRGEAGESIARAATTALHEAVDIMTVLATAFEDGPGLDHRERAALLREIKDAETAIANLRLAVETGVGA